MANRQNIVEVSFCANELFRDAEVKLLSCISSIAGLNPTEGISKAVLNFKNSGLPIPCTGCIRVTVTCLKGVQSLNHVTEYVAMHGLPYLCNILGTYFLMMGFARSDAQRQFKWRPTCFEAGLLALV